MENNILELSSSYTRQRIYDFLLIYITNHGYAPTIREIADGVGLSSSSTVSAHLEMLESMNLIKRDKKKPRSIAISKMAVAEKNYSDKSKWEVCDKIEGKLKDVMPTDQLGKFRKAFFSALDGYVLKKIDT